MNIYTWGGVYFGKRSGDDLWTHYGRHVGRFQGDEVYACDGHYLGEMKNGKLISKNASKPKSRAAFAPKASTVGHAPSVNRVGSVVPVGYEDFPSPNDIQ